MQKNKFKNKWRIFIFLPILGIFFAGNSCFYNPFSSLSKTVIQNENQDSKTKKGIPELAKPKTEPVYSLPEKQKLITNDKNLQPEPETKQKSEVQPTSLKLAPKLSETEIYKKIFDRTFSINFVNESFFGSKISASGTAWLLDYAKKPGQEIYKLFFATNLHVAGALLNVSEANNDFGKNYKSFAIGKALDTEKNKGLAIYFTNSTNSFIKKNDLLDNLISNVVLGNANFLGKDKGIILTPRIIFTGNDLWKDEVYTRSNEELWKNHFSIFTETPLRQLRGKKITGYKDFAVVEITFNFENLKKYFSNLIIKDTSDDENSSSIYKFLKQIFPDYETNQSDYQKVIKMLPKEYQNNPYLLLEKWVKDAVTDLDNSILQVKNYDFYSKSEASEVPYADLDYGSVAYLQSKIEKSKSNAKLPVNWISNPQNLYVGGYPRIILDEDGNEVTDSGAYLKENEDYPTDGIIKWVTNDHDSTKEKNIVNNDFVIFATVNNFFVPFNNLFYHQEGFNYNIKNTDLKPGSSGSMVLNDQGLPVGIYWGSRVSQKKGKVTENPYKLGVFDSFSQIENIYYYYKLSENNFKSQDSGKQDYILVPSYNLIDGTDKKLFPYQTKSYREQLINLYGEGGFWGDKKAFQTAIFSGKNGIFPKNYYLKIPVLKQQQQEEKTMQTS